jgi:O-antigen/teichoic acid export membrane protein
MPRPPRSAPLAVATGRIGAAALAGQLAGIAASPLLTRLYSPAVFGQFTVVTSLANALVPLVALGVGDAVFSARSDRHVRRLVLLAVALSAASVPFIWLAAAAFGARFLPPAMVATWWMAPALSLEVGILALGGVLQAVAAQQLQVARLAVAHLAQGVARPVVQLGATLVSHGLGGLLVGEMACRAASIAALWRAMPPVQWARLRRWRLLSATARHVRGFALARTPSVWLFNLGTALPPILVAKHFGAAAAGQFGLVVLVFSAPIGLVQKAMGDVFAGQYARTRLESPMAASRVLSQAALGLLGIGLLSGLAMRFAAGWALPLVFGPTWQVSGALAAVMAPQLAADLAIGSLGHVLNITARPAWKLLFDVARLLAIAFAFALARYASLSLETTLMCMTWGLVLAYVLYGGLIFRADRATRTV